MSLKIVDLQIDGYERVVSIEDQGCNLQAYIAVHSTRLGPSLGGLRRWQYPNADLALQDVLRLAEGMTYKNAAAGLSLGGGKAVIFSTTPQPLNEARLRSFGRAVDSLGGIYYTAEDMGVSEKDLLVVAQETAYVGGLPVSHGGLGDPAYYTALGVFTAMEVANRLLLGKSDLSGVRIGLQGSGQVSGHLGSSLNKEGALLYFNDCFPERAIALADRFGGRAIDGEAIFGEPLDIFSPSAVGATLNKDTLALLSAPIICGCANNQLAEGENTLSEILRQKRYYFPDFLVNAGGVISIFAELQGKDSTWAVNKIKDLSSTLESMISSLDRGDYNLEQSAMVLVRERLK